MLFFVFPKVFYKTKKSLEKTKHTKEHQKNLRENQQNKNNKPISKGESETFKNCVFLVVPNGCLVFFGFLLYLWCSRRILWFCKNLRKNQKDKQKKNISKGESETFKNFVLLVCPNVFFWCSLVLCCICGFLEGFVGCVKTLGTKTTTKKKHIQG